MDRDNPDWKGRILVTTYNKRSGKQQLSLSSTRQTRESAYQYLRQKARLSVTNGANVTAKRVGRKAA